MKINYFYTTFLLFLCLSNYNIGLAQTYISSNVSANYWQHTELTGLGIGMGLEQKINQFQIAVNYDYGYGSYHRFKKFDNINYDYWSTVVVDENKWTSSLGLADPINEMKAKSDYGKQHQLSLKLGYTFYKKNNNALSIGAGIQGALVEHFFTFTDTIVYHLDIFPFYKGPLNYIPVSHQKFLTYGFNIDVAWDITRNKRIWTPYVTFGFGPKYSSFLSTGLKLSTKLLRKKT